MTNGRISITARALNRTVTAIAAEELRVPARDVSIRLSDENGLLAVDVVAPVRMPGLRSASPRTRGVLKATRDARGQIGERTRELTGSVVGSVAVRITRAVILDEARVA